MARFNCTAMIEEKNAARYLYRYPSNKPLSSIMDTEVRPIIEGLFVNECSSKLIADIIISKKVILDRVKESADQYFKDRGITLTVLVYKGEFTYLDPKIQESINEEFKETNMLEAQKIQNERLELKAEAEKAALNVNPETVNYTLQMKELENIANAIKKWDGKAPLYTGNDGNIFSIPLI